MGLANDVASWEKEKRTYDTAKVLHVIAVQVIKEFSNLTSYEAAMKIACASQQQREVYLDAEVDRLMKRLYLRRN
ncbi:hypothetical protein ASPWEDRAFT_33894 [Aspergillus wentii DTO 134E9]|uniref:Uncharacterized protein n=1 Tax=Aspergillus wentii DTO 134E9 TaxID=1073089 RepID=A0A1L9RZX9_ASPWE|nr:uncharacterized protein ASPWEDRAFT_33894 [Aspergillus wentii DTO 134E9]OJJ40482.1 hypothetical protein ASPWEDRAFT_33894 [Aspergillus wentii DTO 134E9]